MSPTWDPVDLDALGAAPEIRIATVRRDGAPRTPLPIWVVRVGDDLYVRSYHGPAGSWFGQVTGYPYARVQGAGRDLRVRLVPADPDLRTEVDRAYWAKYGRGGFGAAMTTDDAAATTLRLDPGPGVTTTSH
jgi:hypothetical protein